MPKDHLNSIKQQKKLALIHKNNNNHNQVGIVKKQCQNKQQHQRKLSFSDMFLRYILSYNLLSKNVFYWIISYLFQFHISFFFSFRSFSLKYLPKRFTIARSPENVLLIFISYLLCTSY